MPSSSAQLNSSASSDDALASALVTLSKLNNHPFSEDALKSGLPLQNNRLTPDLFPRAAARAGFRSKLVQRPISEIPKEIMPVVLLLEDNKACVLQKLDLVKNTATIIDPAIHLELPQTVKLSELNARYTGYCFFLHHEYDFQSDQNRFDKGIEGHWFWGTLWNARPIYRDVFLASIFINLFVLASPLFVMNVYDRVVPNAAEETLWVLAIGVMIIFIFDLVFKVIRGHLMEIAGQKADVMLSAMIFEKVLGIQMDARPPSVGAFASHLKEFESIRTFMTSATITTLIDLPFVLLFIAVVAYIGGVVALVPLFAVIFIMIYSFSVHFPLNKLVQESVESVAQKHGTLVESLSNVETLKINNAQSKVQRNWEESMGFLAQINVKARVLSNSIMHMTSFVQHFGMVGTVVVGVYQVSDNELSLGGLIACVILTARCIQPMAQVANLTAHFQQAKTVLGTLDKMMQLPTEREKHRDFIHRPVLRGDISFENVSFSYPGQSDQALKKVSFRIKAGEHVAFIGRVGSGKTTLNKLMLGLYEPTEGTIKVDGLDIHQLNPADLRRNIGYVPQDVKLLKGTVRDNILLKAPYADDEELLRVATLSGAKQFINAHPQGFDMPIQEMGEGLSGGQRQALALARGLLLSPPVLLMDEPTSSMDNATEAMIRDHLSPELSGRTLLLSTHRASLLALVERIIVLDGGKVVADGPKDKIITLLKQGKLHVPASN